MKKKIGKLSFLFLMMFTISNIGLWTAPILSASQVSPEQIQLVSEEEIDKFDKYVYQTDTGFGISNQAYAELSQGEIATLEKQISVTNSSFEHGEFVKKGDGFENVVYDSELGIYDATLRGRGVTKINFYWWGFKAYVSRGVARAAGSAGIGVAGYIASTMGVSFWVGALIAAGIGLLGYAVSNIPHGVGVRYTYGVGITAVWWQ